MAVGSNPIVPAVCERQRAAAAPGFEPWKSQRPSGARPIVFLRFEFRKTRSARLSAFANLRFAHSHRAREAAERQRGVLSRSTQGIRTPRDGRRKPRRRCRVDIRPFRGGSRVATGFVPGSRGLNNPGRHGVSRTPDTSRWVSASSYSTVPSWSAGCTSDCWSRERPSSSRRDRRSF